MSVVKVNNVKKYNERSYGMGLGNDYKDDGD